MQVCLSGVGGGWGGKLLGGGGWQMQEIGGASSHSGQVWQEMAGRRRCYPLYPGVRVEERGREEELRGLSGLEKAGVSDCRGHTDTEKGGGGQGSDQNSQSSFHAFPLTPYSLFRASMCKNSCMDTEIQSRQPSTTYEAWRLLSSSGSMTETHTHTGVFPFQLTHRS